MTTEREHRDEIEVLQSEIASERARAETAEAALELQDAEVQRLRRAIGRAWGHVLDDLLSEKMDDGLPVVDYIFANDPVLADRFRAVFSLPPVTPRVRKPDRVAGAKQEVYGDG